MTGTEEDVHRGCKEPSLERAIQAEPPSNRMSRRDLSQPWGLYQESWRVGQDPGQRRRDNDCLVYNSSDPGDSTWMPAPFAPLKRRSEISTAKTPRQHS